MGLFDFLKQKNDFVIIPEPDPKELNWFFSEEAKSLFDSWVELYGDEMWEEWCSLGVYMEPCMREKGDPSRKTYPCTFFADYLRVLKTMVPAMLAYEAADLAIDGDVADAIPYPNCLKPEFNPLINFAIKMKPIFYSTNGKELEANSVVNLMIEYIKDAFLNGVNVSNESWLYEKNLWLDKKGNLKDSSKIKETIFKNGHSLRFVK